MCILAMVAYMLIFYMAVESCYVFLLVIELDRLVVLAVSDHVVHIMVTAIRSFDA